MKKKSQRQKKSEFLPLTLLSFEVSLILTTASSYSENSLKWYKKNGNNQSSSYMKKIKIDDGGPFCFWGVLTQFCPSPPKLLGVFTQFCPSPPLKLDFCPPINKYNKTSSNISPEIIRWQKYKCYLCAYDCFILLSCEDKYYISSYQSLVDLHSLNNLFFHFKEEEARPAPAQTETR